MIYGNSWCKYHSCCYSLKGPEIECKHNVCFFLLHVIKTYDQQPKVWFLFPAVFTPADFKTYVSRCESWKIHNFLFFFEGDWFCKCLRVLWLLTQVSTSAGVPSSGDPVHALTPFPNVAGPCIRPERVLYLKTNKAIWKTQSKMGVEVPVVSIYTWDVAIFCCTFGLLQRRKGSLGVS